MTSEGFFAEGKNMNSNNLKTHVVLAAVCLAIAGTASAGIICVDDDAAGGGDGSSWSQAYRHLQDALADANDSEKPVEIRVAQGIYKPDRSSQHPDGTGDRNASFVLLDAVTILGGFAGLGSLDPNRRDFALYETVLSGDLAGDDVPIADPCDLFREPTRAENSLAVVTAGACSRSAVLDGFTIRSGNATRSARLDFAQRGGGLFLSYYGADCCPSIRDCTFSGNCAYHGGAVFTIGAGPEFIDCRFVGNVAAEGGAMATGAWRCPCFSTCDLAIRGCTFAGNYALNGGGAIDLGAGGPYTIESSRFMGNIAGSGGALHIAVEVHLVNCLFAGNVAHEQGGAVYCNGFRLDVASCTFADNAAPAGPATVCFCPQATIRNTIFWNGGDDRHAEIFIGEITGLDMSYCNVQGGWPGEGNIHLDPLFARRGYWASNGTPENPGDDFYVEGDYHLKSQAGRWDPNSEAWVVDETTSPCIDAGDPNAPVGYEALPDGDRINMGVYGGTLEASKSVVQESVTSPPDLWEELLDSVIGESDTTPSVWWARGYVERITLSGESYISVPNVDPNNPAAVALRFLDTWQDLFAAPSGAMAFELGRVVPMSSGTLVSLRQMYAGLEVFGATFNIRVNSSGGVRGVVFTDLMTDATALDRRPDSIKPSIGPVSAQHLAEAYMRDRHGGAAYVASAPELVIYAPEVVSGSGSPRPAWHTVANPANGVCGEMLLLDACSGEIILSNPLCVYADRL